MPLDHIPPHFHKTDRISEEDIFPDGRVVSQIPSGPAPEGTEVTYVSGATIRRYKMVQGTWRYWSLT